MPVPSTISDLSITAAVNSPAGTESVTTAAGPDEYFRTLSALLRREQAQAVAVASAATVDLGAIADGNYVHITGTTAITSFGTVAAGIARHVIFDDALTLTYNATSLILPGFANITTKAGDSAVFVSEGSGNWRCGPQIGSAASGANTDITSLASPALASATATTQAASDNSTKVATTAFVTAAIAAIQGVPSGAVAYFGMVTAPTGWLKANGAAISRTTYAALFAAIGTAYGAGDGSTTFNLPDLRGKFLRAFDDAAGVDAGRPFGSTQSSQNLSHSHTASTDTAAAHQHTAINASGGGTAATGFYQGYTDGATAPTDAAGAHSHVVTVAADGGNESRPINVALLACIKY